MGFLSCARKRWEESHQFAGIAARPFSRKRENERIACFDSYSLADHIAASRPLDRNLIGFGEFMQLGAQRRAAVGGVQEGRHET